MNNFDIARNALETSLNSSGSAMAEHAKWSESLEARLLKLKAAWQSLSQSFLNSDFLKVAIELATDLVDVLDKLVSTFGTLGTIGLGAGAFGLFKNFKDIKPLLKNLTSAKALFQGLGKTFLSTTSGMVGGIGIAVAAFGLIYNAIKNYKEEISQARQETINASDTFLDAATSFEQAYIKYSGKTSLTSEEEAELSSAIHGAVDALGDKSSALQDVVNSSDNYLKSLEAIKNAELEAAERAASEKKDAARKELKDTVKGWTGLDGSEVNVGLGIGNSAGQNEAIKIAQEMNSEFVKTFAHRNGQSIETEFTLSANADVSEIIDYYYTLLEYKEKLSDAELTDTTAYEQVSSAIGKMSESIETYTSGVYDAAKAQYQLANGIPKTAEEYLKMRQAILNDAEIKGLSFETKKTIAGSLDSEYGQSIDLTSVEVQARKLLGVLDEFDEKDAGEVETFLTLRTKVNDNDCTVGEYLSQLDKMSGLTEGWDEGQAKEFKSTYGLDTDSIEKQYKELSNKTTKEFLDSLTASELSAAYNLRAEIDWVNGSPEEILAQIKETAAVNEAMSFTFSIAVETEGIELLNTALAESVSATGLTADSITALKSRYEDLEGFNAAALFEETAIGVRLNSQELEKLEAQYESVNKIDVQSNLNTLLMKYRELTEEIKKCTNEQEKEKLQNQADTYADKIEELSLLASQYDGLTSAFNKWQTAQSSANAGDNYVSLYENLESIKELYDNGLVGTDDFKTAAQLMTNKDLTGAPIEEYVSAFEEGYPKMERYFTEGQEGCKRFLNDVSNLNSEWAHLNEDGKWEINFDPEELADKAEMSVDSILLIAERLKDYGFEINLETDTTSIDKLETEIEKHEARVKELGGTPYPINLTVEGSAVDTEIEKIKAHISSVNGDASIEPEMKTAQLDEARAKLEVLIQKKQEAEQPAYMTLNTSQVNASLVDALEKVQAYQTALNELNKLNELKEAGITIDDSQIDSAQQKVNEYAKAIQGLDNDVKLAIGLEEDGSIESIKKAFEDEKVHIDADTSVDNKDIDLANKGLKELTDTVKKLKEHKNINIEVDVMVKGAHDLEELVKNIDLVTDVEGNVANFSEYVDGVKELSGLDKNITSYVTANINGNVTESSEKKLDNIGVFAEGAKELEGVGSFTSNVTANINGNVKDTPEYAINNLKTFSESAKDVESIGNVESKVTANVDGNVTHTAEYMLNNLETFSDSAKNVESIGNVESNVTANVNGNVKNLFEGQIDNLKTYTDSAKDIENIGDVKSSVSANIEGNVTGMLEMGIDNLAIYSDSAKDVKDIGEVKSSVTADVKGNVTGLKTEAQIDNLSVYSDGAKAVKNIGNVESSVIANVEGNVTDEFEYRLDNLDAFANSAKDLSGVGFIESNITANVNGNVTDEFEYKLDNLDVFSDSAKNLKNIGDIESNVDANVDGNVLDTSEGKIEGLKTFADSAKNLKNIGDISSEVVAEVSGSVLDTRENKIDNLKVFADSAKNIKSIGDVESNVTANVEGNVIDTREGKIDNLKVFTDNAKNIDSIGDVTSSVTADVEGNVIDTRENKIDNLKVFADSAKNVKSIGDVTSSVTADVDGNVIETAEYMLDNLKVFTDSAKNIKNIGSNTKAKVTANISGNVINTAENKLDNIGVFADNAKEAKNVGNFTSSVSANVNGNITTDDSVISDLEHFASVANGMSTTSPTITVEANVNGEGIVDDLEEDISDIEDKSVTITATASGKEQVEALESAVDKVKEKSSSPINVMATMSGNALSDAQALYDLMLSLNGMYAQTVTDNIVNNYINYIISYIVSGGGAGGANGTANVDGTAFADGTVGKAGKSGKAYRQGNWGTKDSGMALMGELGRKLFATIHSDMY